MTVRRSKLETHVDILRALDQQGPLRLTHLMYMANLNCKVLKQYLDLLIQRNLVEEQKQKRDKWLYAITEEGLKALTYYKQLDNAFKMTARA